LFSETGIVRLRDHPFRPSLVEFNTRERTTMTMKTMTLRALTCAMTLLFYFLLTSTVSAAEPSLYMGAPVTLVEAPNGAIINKKILEGVDKVAWLKPTIEQPVEGVWVLGGYGLAPMSLIDTDEGLIAFDTGDSKHDGEILLEAIRTVSDKPIKAIIYGHSHTAIGAGVLAEGNKEVLVIGHPDLTSVVEKRP
jgi:hypothetical protein